MIEYLIRRTDGEWFDLQGQLEAALKPSSFPSRRIEGWGDWRIQTQGVEISFSYEDPGIQVCIEGELPPHVADQMAEEIRRNVERVTGQKGRVVAL